MLEEEFIKFGYTKKEYDKIRNSYPINKIKDETLLIKLKEISKFFLDLDYSKEDIIKMTKSEPTLYYYSICTIKQKIEDIISLGYTKEDVIKMIRVYSTLCVLSIESIKQKMENIISLGYTKEEVLKMTGSYAILYSLSIKSIKQKIEAIKSLGYTKEEVLKMTLEFPILYGLNIETIKQKIKFYNDIGMRQHIISNPKHLIQGVALSYARYNFYLSRGININLDNCEKLFAASPKLERTYGIKKERLLEMFDYDEHMHENSILTDTITDMEVFNSILAKRANFILDCIKAKGTQKIDSIETQKEIEKIMMKRIFR